jgi:hypothetical protein
MNTNQLTTHTRPIPDITAWDKDGQKVLVSKVKKTDLPVDLAQQLQAILNAEKEENGVVVPFAMTVTLQEIEIYRWDGQNLEKQFSFPTKEVLSAYDQNFGNKRIFGYYLETLVEAWLRDFTYHWKLENPSKSAELEQIGLTSAIADVVSSEG